MKLYQFDSAVESKESSWSSNYPPSFGTWKNSAGVSSVRVFTPLDECPNCGEYDYQYKAYEKIRLVRSTTVLRAAFCKNCKYSEEVEEDPQKGSNNEYL